MTLATENDLNLSNHINAKEFSSSSSDQEAGAIMKRNSIPKIQINDDTMNGLSENTLNSSRNGKRSSRYSKNESIKAPEGVGVSKLWNLIILYLLEV